MNNEISFQQVRTPIAVALTVILNSMFALPSDARLTDLSKVESPLILASILFIFPLAIWNHPPSLAASGTTLLILSLLAHSHRGTYGDFEHAARPLWFTAGLLLGAALAFVARKHVRSTLSQASGWRYILPPARLTEAIVGISTILVLFRPSNPQFIHVEHAECGVIPQELLVMEVTVQHQRAICWPCDQVMRGFFHHCAETRQFWQGVEKLGEF